MKASMDEGRAAEDYIPESEPLVSDDPQTDYNHAQALGSVTINSQCRNDSST